MDQGEQSAREIGEGQKRAGEFFVPKEEFSFAKLLERFYHNDGSSLRDKESTAQSKPFNSGN